MTAWTTADIPDQTGRTAVVTGANSGLGFATASALAASGAAVVLACRDETRGNQALERIRRDTPSAQVALELLDLADLSSIRAFAERFAAAHGPLDVLVNNAGVMAIPRRETTDGFELQFGTNHLGHFALTGLLLGSLLARTAPRVVTVSSQMASTGTIHFDDLSGTRRYGKWRAYGQAKLANQLFAFELDRRARAAGTDLVSVAAHPGYAATNLQSAGARMTGSRLSERITDLGNSLFAQSAADGALPSLYGATAPDVRGGQYFGPDRLFHMRGHPTTVAPVRAARDTDVARRLWERSVELTGVAYDDLARAG
jgi:NAD(P)-dependent dehydrogenase (short-subunit alcohol dehydrogenase family)